jgi:NADH dehydrogenase
MAAKIVVLGGGFAGVSAARELERRAPADAHITLVNRENFQLFTPMLPEVASGALDMRAIVSPLRVTLKRAQVVLGEVSAVDVASRIVTVDLGVLGTQARLPFDHLVFALGSETSTHDIPGIAEHAYQLKTLPDAGRLRARVGSAFEAAAAEHDRVKRDRWLRFVIAGGGFTGVEAAGELTAYLQRLHRYYPTLHDMTPEIVLVESGRRLLEHLAPEFGKRAAASLRARNVRIELGEDIASCDADGLSLKSGKRCDSHTIVWAAGEKPAPLLRKSGLQISEHGALVVGSDFAVPGVAGIWGIGDCARIPKAGGGDVAPLAQNAVREGPLLARNIVAALAGEPSKPFTYRPLGMMASLGDRDAVAQLPGNRMIAGFPAWLMWRAYYLGQLPGVARKLRVAGDWTVTGLFAQNVARLPWISDRLTVEEDHAPEG